MKTTPFRAMTSFAVLGLALGLAGCGSSHHDDKNASASSTTQSKQQTGANSPVANALNDFGDAKFHRLTVGNSTKSANVSPATYAMPKWNTPLSDYIPLPNNNAIMFQYYAHTGMSPDYKTIASNFDSRYANSSDVFTKHKIIKQLKPIVDQRIAAAKAHPYVYWPMYNLSLDNYSFKRHGFPVEETLLLSGGYAQYDNYQSQDFSLNLRNAGDFSFLPVKNQKLAQKMEHWISNGGSLYVQPYLFINGASLSNHEAHAICTRINVYGPHKELVMSYTPPHHS